MWTGSKRPPQPQTPADGWTAKTSAAMGRYQPGLEGDRKPLFTALIPRRGLVLRHPRGADGGLHPDAKLLEGMRVSLPRQVVNEVFIKGRNLL